MQTNQPRRRRALGVSRTLLALLAALLVGTYSGWAAAQTMSTRIGGLEREVETLSQSLALLQATYVDRTLADSGEQLDRRLTDGHLLFFLGDYARASVVFLDIVENGAARGTLTFREARYYLAESLYLANNLTAARGYFEEIADDEADRRRLDAIQRLLEVSFRSHHYERLDALYTQLRDITGTSAPPDVTYVLGKALFFQGDSTGAIAEFGRIPMAHEHYIQARYFMGTAYVRLEQWDRAIEAFEEVRRAAPESSHPDADAILDLARLALGRVYYELDQPQAALDAYQAVSRTSAQYDRALYEMCWTYIVEERYEDALQALEILLLAVPDSRYSARAELLRGDLLVRMADYDAAQEVFGETVERFGPLEDRLAGIIDRESDPDDYFAALIDPASATLILPDLARQWVEDSREMERALAVVADLESQSEEILESREIIEDIETVISSSGRIDMFPELRQGFGQALEIQHRLLALLARANTLEAGLVPESSLPERRAAYDRARQRRLELGARFADLPQTYEEMSEHESAVDTRLEGLSTDVYRQSYEIQTQRAQIVAMRLMLREDLEIGERTQQEVDELTGQLEQLDRQLGQLERDRGRLRRELEQEQLRTGIQTVATGGTDRLLERYLQALIDEAEALVRLRASASDDRDLLERLDGIRRQGAEVTSTLERFFGDVDRLIEQQTRDIIRQVDVERALMDEYERLLQRYGQQGERLAGEIAFASFIDVQDQFHELVLRADVGIIDVAWREKEDRSQRIDRLFDERNHSLDVLDTQFREVLEGD